jgi:hypothetical protein
MARDPIDAGMTEGSRAYDKKPGDPSVAGFGEGVQAAAADELAARAAAARVRDVNSMRQAYQGFAPRPQPGRGDNQ